MSAPNPLAVQLVTVSDSSSNPAPHPPEQNLQLQPQPQPNCCISFLKNVCQCLKCLLVTFVIVPILFVLVVVFFVITFPIVIVALCCCQYRLQMMLMQIMALREDQRPPLVFEQHLTTDDKKLGVHPIRRQECVICQDDFQPASELGCLKCQHIFHLACLKDWCVTKREINCPLCNINSQFVLTTTLASLS